MSKRVQNGCRYKFVQGPKKGKLCKKPCRGQYCKNHNKNRKVYIKKYYEDHKTNKFDEKVKKLGIMDIDKLPLKRELHKSKLYKEEYIDLYKTKIGISKFLEDEDFEVQLNKIKKYLLGNCTCITKEEIVENYDKRQKIFDQKDFQVYYLKNDDYKNYKYAYKYIEDNYKCIHGDNCEKYSMDGCKFCAPPIGRVFYREFDGSDSYAILKKQRIEKRMKILEEKMKNQKEIIKLINERINKN